MNQELAGPQFDPSMQYAKCICQIFICMFYFSGMPILLYINLLSLVFTYWKEKYFICTYYSKSKQLDEQINNGLLFFILAVMDRIQYAAIIHVCNSCWLYGSPYLFPDVMYFSYLEFFFYELQLNVQSILELVHVYRKSNFKLFQAYKVYWYAIFTALVIVVFVFKNTLVKFLMNIFGGTN